MSCFIIAEAGVNHNGDLDLAHRLIDAAAEAGADAVKFQTFRAGDLVTATAPQAEYQTVNTGAEESQYAMLKRLELPFEVHGELMDHCARRGILFLSTAFDPVALDFLLGLGLPMLKCPSGEITNAPLLLRMAQSGKDVILSTGMSDLADIRAALAVLAVGYLGLTPGIASFDAMLERSDSWDVLAQRVTLLHCTTAYPTPAAEVNLRAMTTLAEAFNLKVGLSDHSEGILAAVTAVGMGAVLVEKHFTLDRALPGPDHKASLEPDELAEMIRAIRQTEAMLGSADKAPSPSEIGNRDVARKSLVALVSIGKGETFSTANLGIKRPGNGLSPLHYWDMLGRTARTAYQPDQLIAEAEL
jgi:N-acetylneuraminate synthase